MTDAEEFDDVMNEPSAIGVGMGGSCPVCRAPVDLGQEFCLECGSPIRFTPRQRRQQKGRPADGAARAGSGPAAPTKSGFPWVPFLIVLALIGGGVAFALVDGGEASGGKESKTEAALPEITNSLPEDTTSDTKTTTVDDCATAGADTTQPAIGDAGTSTEPTIDPLTGQPSSAGSEQIPSLTDGASDDAASTPGFDDPSVPSTTDDDPATVTVDRSGFLCGSDSSSDPASTDPATTTPTTPSSTTDTTPTTSGAWPAGKDGWTVVVFGYDTQERATQAAADLQENGFSDGGVLLSSDYASLCPGIYVVFSGVFDRESEANARKSALSAKDYAGMYVREISTTGSPSGDCSSSRPQN